MYTKSCPHDFLFIFTPSPRHLIYEERESHENHWSAPFIFAVHAGCEKRCGRWRGGSSHVNLIDYLKGRGDLVNTQALLNNTHTHTYIKEHAWLFDVFLSYLPSKRDLFKECVFLDKHMLTIATRHSNRPNHCVMELFCTFIIDGNIAHPSPISCSLHTWAEEEEAWRRRFLYESSLPQRCANQRDSRAR